MSNDIPTYEDCPECDSKLTVYTHDEYCVDVHCRTCEFSILVENLPDDL